MAAGMERRIPTLAVLGAGLRGNIYAEYFLENPGVGTVTAVAEPDAERLNAFAEKHGIPEQGRFLACEEFLSKPKMCDAVLICTQDRQHYDAVMSALEKGYHVFVEKPMSPDPRETLAMAKKAEEKGLLLIVGHVLRYTPFFHKLKTLIDDGKIGEVVSLDLIENVEHIHYSHSFVRGNWGNSGRSSFMLLSKSCHDIDIIHWLIGHSCLKVSSFGSLKHFTSENAPAGSTERCLDGCAVERTCPYSARKIYVERDSWYYRAITNSDRKEDRLKAIAEGPYGRCVYRCDNDVVDHQVVAMEFEDGITASFSMVGLTHDNTRTIKIFGTKGQIRGHMSKNEIEIANWDGEIEIIRPKTNRSGHGGGDHLIMEEFAQLLQTGDTSGGRTSGRKSADSHLIAFAAEASRVRGQTVSLQEYIGELKDGQAPF